MGLVFCSMCVAKQIPYEEVEEIEPISININFVDTKEEE